MPLTETCVSPCHQLRPALIIDEAIVNVFKLKLSAIQKEAYRSKSATIPIARIEKLTKFQPSQVFCSFLTGKRSSVARNISVLVRPSAWLLSSFFRIFLALNLVVILQMRIVRVRTRGFQVENKPLRCFQVQGASYVYICTGLPVFFRLFSVVLV